MNNMFPVANVVQIVLYSKNFLIVSIEQFLQAKHIIKTLKKRKDGEFFIFEISTILINS